MKSYLLHTLVSAQFLLFETKIALDSPTSQRDGLVNNINLYDSNGVFLQQLFICNTCTISYYFSDAYDSSSAPTYVLFREND